MTTNNRVTEAELRVYRTLRNFNEQHGVTDEQIPRKRITRSMARRGVTRDFYQECVEEELRALHLAIVYKNYDVRAKVREEFGDTLKQAEGWKREALRARDEIRGYRTTLGLDPETG